MSEDLIQRCRRVLAAYKPRRIQDERMAPAAVLILLYEKEGEPYVLLTERTQEVEHHKGETSFPGGASDSDDPDLMTTALREIFEEIGVRPEDVEVIGQLDDLITISNFNVTPYVGVLTAQSPYPFVVHEREVAAVVEVPLRHLLDDRSMELELRQWRGQPVLVPAYTYDRHRIWGATARILQQLLGLLS
ncbi:MAG: NUDIX hydrolase [Dehalococcoidia bacterium]